VTDEPDPRSEPSADPGAAAAAAERFVQVAHDALDDLMALDPVHATALGDHRFDDRLPDESPAAVEEATRVLSGWLGAVDSVDDAGLDPQLLVDLETLRSALAARLFAREELREHTWNPLQANPGSAVYLLLARDFAPLGDRLRSVAGRLSAVPGALAQARESLLDMPRVHVETAIAQFTGTRGLVEREVAAALDREPSLRPEVEPARQAALEALDDHLAWLESRLPDSDRNPRLGGLLYAAKLWHALDTETPPDTVLVRAESDLMRIEAEIAEVLDGADPRAAFDRLADEGPVDDSTVLPLCATALDETTAFVREHDLVTVPGDWDDLVQIIEMPEIHRGVAVAYCDPPGPLEPATLPTFFAVSPTPADWPPDRVRSFYREYNAFLIRNLTVHEAMPGHVLQLAHSRAHRGVTPVRKAFWSGPFVEGWAVYAEELMVRHGFGGAPVRLQQLKMQLRSTINAILDVRVHAHGMTEDEAMSLMTQRGHQEVGEAAGKWRRAQLTSAQLSTYYVGYVEVADVARALAAVHPAEALRDRHDRMLAHGSPSPRHLRTLLGLPAGGPPRGR
jgi:uncharacterized protein (DUF885 family)